jgi:hypothetical protein
MNRLGILQGRIAMILRIDPRTIYHHLGKMAVLSFSLNGDLPLEEYLEFIATF